MRKTPAVVAQTKSVETTVEEKCSLNVAETKRNQELTSVLTPAGLPTLVLHKQTSSYLGAVTLESVNFYNEIGRGL